MQGLDRALLRFVRGSRCRRKARRCPNPDDGRLLSPWIIHCSIQHVLRKSVGDACWSRQDLFSLSVHVCQAPRILHTSELKILLRNVCCGGRTP